MGISRRNTLVGLGGLIAGGGALAATGAFDTVEAERTVNVETTGDSSALLALEPADRDGDGGNAYVSDPGDGTIEINLDGTDDADGINQNARTRIENLVLVTNQGTQEVNTLEFDITVAGSDANTDHEEAFKITSGDATIDANENDLLDKDETTDSLTTGDSVSFGVEIDLLDGDISAIDTDAEFTLTITAENTS